MTSYFTHLFTPETWDAFRKHGATVSGFRERQRKTAERIRPGDRLLCYLVRLSRWCGILEVASGPYIDSSPIFSNLDPFVVRFAVRSEVLLDLERSIPIFEPSLWSELSLTRDMQVRSFGWAQQAKLRSSLMVLNAADGELLTTALSRQAQNQREYPLTAQDHARVGRKQSVRTVDREVIVEVPEKVDGPEALNQTAPEEEFRESHRVQATLARIGAEMDFRIWVPRSDRQKVLDQVPTGSHSAFLDALPLNYDDTTLKTVEQIDVIWLKG